MSFSEFHSFFLLCACVSHEGYENSNMHWPQNGKHTRIMFVFSIRDVSIQYNFMYLRN